jgi:TolB-like protein/class 3 adenylate cyclase/Tfp pilus assembly protein PilF
MAETRKLAAILVSDIVGYSRLAGSDEERLLARLRTLRSDLIDPTVAVHHGRFVKRTGDGAIIEFRSVVDAVRCAIEIQNSMVERNSGLGADQRIVFRVGIHLGDVVEEEDGDLMGDGVNIAARLEGIAEPGGIVLSEDAYRQVKARLDLKVIDLGPTQLKNIAEPIRVYSLEIRQQGLAPPSSVPTQGKSAPPRLSIVVLPFANLGGDTSQDYFVDGVTESLTTDLSRISGSFVIARNTAFTYKGKNADIKEIGRELNVRYVLEGSIQRSKDRVRVNAQLIDAGSGAHLWVDRFDKSVIDLFELQDEIVVRLANCLFAQLTSAEARRARLTVNPDSMDLLFQGMDWIYKGVHPEFLSQGLSFFKSALMVDPANVDALAHAAAAECALASNFFQDEQSTRFAAAEMMLTKALSFAPEHARAHSFLGYVYVATNRSEQAIVQSERALAIDPNLTYAYATIGMAKYALGRSEETEPYIRQAIRLSPRDTFMYWWFTAAGVSAILIGDDERAKDWFRQSIDANRNYSIAYFYLASSLASLGRLDEAKKAAREGFALYPQFSIGRARKSALSNNPTYLAQRERIYDGMRKAGVPEGD